MYYSNFSNKERTRFLSLAKRAFKALNTAYRQFVRAYKMVFQPLLAMLLSAFMVTPMNLWSLPTGLQPVHGQLTVDNSVANQLTIQQQSDKLILNWDQFSIGQGESTIFIQPSAQSAALNRVVGRYQSQLDGLLQANGQVFLLNPNGVVIGRTGIINTQSFIASTANVTNEDFLDGGDLTFFDAPEHADAIIQNLGAITANGGDIFLIAQKVDNAGHLTAAEGTVGLAGATEVLLLEEGSERLAVRVNDLGGSIDNSGAIQAAQAELKAVGGNPYALAINSEGFIGAAGTVEKDGRIILSANSGKVSVDGELVAENTSTETGGTIKVMGDEITLGANAALNASAKNGGGAIYVGGGKRGADIGGTIAENIFIESGANLSADALLNGDGGQIIAFAEGSAEIYGSFSARGGAESGDGGFVETSGKESWLFANWVNNVDVSAAYGTGGEFLIDPNDITINHATGPGGTVSGSPVTANTILDFDINTFLDNTGSLVIQTDSAASGGNGDIFLNGFVDINWSTSNSLTINADRDIIVGIVGVGSASIFSDDANITLNAGRDIQVVNGSSISSGVSLGSGGDIKLSAQRSVELANSSVTNIAGAIDIDSQGSGNTASVGIEVNNSTVSTSSGAITLDGIGGDDEMGGLYGVHIHSGSTVSSSSTTTGNIAILGAGGNEPSGSSGNQVGVLIEDGATQISAVGGNITITGTGGSSNGSNSIGVRLVNGVIDATENAAITITGTGGSGGSNNSGVEIEGGTIDYGNGNLLINGQVGANSGDGLVIQGNTQITATSANNLGNIVLTGVTSNAGDVGIVFNHTAGNINITNFAGSLTLNGGGINPSLIMTGSLNTTTLGSATATGDINISTDDLFLDTNTNLSFLTGGNLNLTQSMNGTSIGLGNLAPGTLSISVGEYNVLSSNVSAVNIGNSNSGDITINDLTLNSALGVTGADVILVGTSGGLSAGVFDVNLTATRDFRMDSLSEISSTSGNILLQGSDSLILSSSNVSSTSGDITVQSSAFSGNAVNINGATISNQSGNILIQGSGSAGQIGIATSGNALIQSTGTGTITLLGTGGSSGGGNIGIALGGNSSIQSVVGDIILNGTGTTGDGSMGIQMTSTSNIRSTGTGASAANITINGTGGSGSNGDFGIAYSSNSANGITAVDGDITISGTGGGSNIANSGLAIGTDAVIHTTGTGDLILTGIGSGTTDSNGIQFGSNVSIVSSTGSGDVVLNGTGPSGLADIFFNSLTITKPSGGTVTFNDEVSGTTLIAGGGTSAYNIAFNDGGTITDAVVFGNTGTLTFGDASIDSFTFTNGITATAPADILLAGTLSTTNNAIILGNSTGNITLTSDTIIDAGTAIITIDSDIDAADGSQSLTVNSSNTTRFNGLIGDGQPLATLRTDASGTTILGMPATTTTASPGVETLGNLIFNDTVFVSNNTTIVSGGDLVFNGTVDSNDAPIALLLSATNDVIFRSAVGQSNGFTSLTSGAGGDIFVGDNISTFGGNLIFNDNVILTASSIMDTNGGSIQFSTTAGDSISTDAAGYLLDLDTSISVTGPGGDIILGLFDAAGGALLNGLTIDTTGGGDQGTTTIANNIQLGNDGTTAAALSIAGDVEFSSDATLNLGSTTGPGGSVNLSSASVSATTAGVDVIIDTTYLGTGSNNGGLITLGEFASKGGNNISNLMLDAGSSIGGVAGNIIFTNDITLSGNLDVVESGNFTLNSGANVSTGGGNIAIGANNVFTIGSSASLTTTTGNITLNANTDADPTGEFAAFFMDGGTIETADGNIQIDGRGGDQSTGSDLIGIQIQNGSLVRATGLGAITLNGTGGNGTSGNVGILLSGSSVTGTFGNITLQGTGSGTTTGNNGIRLESSANIESLEAGAGGGTITLVGTGGNGTDTNNGIFVDNSTIGSRSDDATITLTGTGGGTGIDNNGIDLNTVNLDVATSNADITLTGIGAGTASDGIELTALNLQSAFGGDVTFNGTRAGTSFVFDIRVTDALTLSKGGGEVIFNDQFQATTLNVNAGAYDVTFNDGGGISNAVTFNNTGILSLGNSSADALTFTSGLTATAPSVVNLAVSLATSNDDAIFGPVNLVLNTGINAGVGNVHFTDTVDGARALDVISSGTTTFSGLVGSTTPLQSILTRTGTTTGTTVFNIAGGSTLGSPAVQTTGDQTYNDNVRLDNSTALVSSGGDITFNENLSPSTIGIGFAASVGSPTGTLTFENATSGFDTVTVGSTGKTVINGSISTDGAQTYGNAVELGADIDSAFGGVVLSDDLIVTADARILSRGSNLQIDGDISAQSQGLSLELNAVVAGSSGGSGNIAFGNVGNAAGTGEYLNSLVLDVDGPDSDGIFLPTSEIILGDDGAGGLPTLSFSNGSLVIDQDLLINLSFGTLDTQDIDLSNLSSISASVAGSSITLNNAYTGAASNDTGDVFLGVFDNAGGEFVQDLTVQSTNSGTGSPGFVQFAGDVTLEGVLDVDAGNVGVSTGSMISLTGLGAGVAFDVSDNVLLDTGSSLSTINGDVIINANNDVDTSGMFNGVLLDGSTLSTTSGNIQITGHAGDSSADSDLIGIQLINGAQINSTGSGASIGTITLNGTGGAGTSGNNGISLTGSSSINAVSGNIALNGTGGNGTTTANRGVVLADGSTINSTGTGANAGTITLIGTGGSGTSSNIGVDIFNLNTGVFTVDGDILIQGTAGGTTTANDGIFLDNSADIVSTGNGVFAGTITLEGTGGNGTDSNNGILAQFVTASIRSADGDITLSGTGGGIGVNNDGIYLIQSNIETTGAANITLNGTGSAAGSGNGIDISNNTTIVSPNAGNITFNGTKTGPGGTSDIQFDTLSLSKTGGQVIFNDAVAGATLTVNAGAYDILFNDGGSIANAATFNHTGSLTFGDNVADSMTFTNGVTATAPSVVNLAGDLDSNLGTVILGPVALIQDTTVNAGNNDVTFTGLVDGNQSLTINSGGTTAFQNAVGSVTGLDSLITDGSGSTLISANINTDNGSILLNDSVTLAGDVLINTGNGSGNVSFTKSIQGQTTARNLSVTAGSGSVTFSDSVGGANLIDGIDVSGQSITLNGLMTSVGNNAVNLIATRNIVINSGGGITTTDSAVNLIANQAGGLQGQFVGVNIDGGSIITNGTGNISIEGRGGDDFVNDELRGVFIQDGALIQSTSAAANAGTITITGTGGTTNKGSDENNNGVTIFGLGGSGTLVTSVSGDIVINGTAGDGVGNQNIGVYVSSADVTSTGTGVNAANITINGTGGNALANNNGVRLENASSLGISSVDGDITITGTGAGTDGASHGVFLSNGGQVLTSGSGDITIDGTGSATGTHGNGIYVFNSSVIDATGSGDIMLTGTGGSTTFIDIGNGIQESAGTNIIGQSGSGNVTFNGTAISPNNEAIKFNSLTFNKTGGTVTFNDAVEGATLVVNTGAHNMAFNAGGRITNATTLNNTGTLTLGLLATDTTRFDGGITATAPSVVNIAGSVLTSNGAMSFAALNLTADATLNAGSSTIQLANGATSSGGGLTASAAGGIDVDGTIDTTAGGSTAVVSLTGPINLNADILTDSADILFDGSTIISAAGPIVIDSESGDDGVGGAITFQNGSISANGFNPDLTIDASTAAAQNGGAITISSIDDSAGNFINDLTVDSSGGASDGIVTLNGNITLGPDGPGDPATLILSGDVRLPTSVLIDLSSSVNAGGADLRGATFSATTTGVNLSITNRTLAGATSNTGNLFLGSFDDTAGNFINAFDIDAGNEGSGSMGNILFGLNNTFDGDLNVADGVSFVSTPITSNGGALTFQDVTLQANGFFDTSSGNGNVTFNGDVIGQSSARDLLVTAGNGAVIFNGNVGSGNLIDGIDVSAQSITVGGGVLTSAGTDAVNLTAIRTIVFNTGSGITTTDSDVNLIANQTGGLQGNFTGIEITGSTITTNGTGNISIQGRGGDDFLTGQHIGVSILNGSTVSSTATGASAGTLTITGTGGSGTTGNSGVEVASATVQTADGTISIAGDANGSDDPAGVFIASSTIETTASADIVLAGSSTSSAGSGLFIQSSNINSPNSGNISLLGSGGSAFEAITFDTLAFTKTGGVVTFDRIIDGSILTANAGAYDVIINQGGLISDTATLNNTGLLQINGTSTDTFRAANGLTAAAPSEVRLIGNLLSNSSAIVLGPTVLTGDVVIGDVTAAPSSVTFASTIDSAASSNHNLLIDTSGSVEFQGIIGGTQLLNDLSVSDGTTTGGMTTFNIAGAAPQVHLTGNAFFDDELVLEQDVEIRVLGDITLNGSVNSGTLASALQLSPGVGQTTTINGSLGSVSPLSAFSTGINGTTAINDRITTTGAQTYNNLVQLGADLTTTTASGTVQFVQAVDLISGSTISSGGNVVFDATIDGNNNLIVNSSGQTQFNAAVGSTTTLANLTTDGPGSTLVAADITTNGGDIILNDTVTLGGDILLSTGIGMGDVTFGSSVQGQTTARNLMVTAGTGSVSFNGAVGGANLIDGIDVSGESIVLNALMTSAGNNAVNLTATRDLLIGSGAGISTASSDINLIANQAGGLTGLFVGIDIDGGSITSNSGNILLQGRGGDDGATGHHYGILLNNGASIGSTGAATITLQGTGASGLDNNHGIALIGNSTITSSEGAISLTGTGGAGSADANRGIYIAGGSDIQSSGTASSAAQVTLIGTGGSGTNNNQGIFIEQSGTTITSIDGLISISGTGGGTGTNNAGVAIADSAFVTSTGTGNITLTGIASTTGSGAGVSLTNSGSVAQIGSGDLTFNGTGNGGDADISFDSLTIGKTGGTVTFNDTVGGSTLIVNTGNYDLVFNGGGSITNPVTLNNTGNIDLGDSGTVGVLTTGDVTFSTGNVLNFDFSGGTPATDQDQLTVTGSVNLGGSTLNLSGGFVASAGSELVLIDNDGTDDVVIGTFDGLAEGASVTVGGFTGFITYAGGDGNDVTLRTDGPFSFDTTGGSGNFGIQLNGSVIEFLDGTTVVSSRDIAFITDIVITGADGVDDVLVIDYAAGGFFNLPIAFDGGTGGNDGLTVIGTGTTDGTYTPDAALMGNGMIDVDTATITFTGLEPIDITGMASAILNTPSAGGDDLLTIANGTDFFQGGTNDAIRVSGTTGGVAIETVAFWNNGSVTIDTTALDGNDILNFTSASNSHGITDFLLNTGNGLDVININGDVTFTGEAIFNTGGSVFDGGGRITAADLKIDAGTGIGTALNPIRTAVTNFAARTSTSGGIFITELDAINIATVDGLMGLDSAGDISAVTAGDISSSQAMNAVGTTTLDANNNINLGAALNTAGLVIDANAFSTTSTTAVDTLEVTLTSSNLVFTDNDGFSITGINVGSNDVTLTTTANVTQTGAIQAGILELLGAGGDYDLKVNNAITTLVANTGTLAFGDDDGFTIAAANGTTGINTTGNTVLNSTGAGTGITVNEAIVAGGDITITSSSDSSLNLNADLDAAGNLIGNSVLQINVFSGGVIQDGIDLASAGATLDISTLVGSNNIDASSLGLVGTIVGDGTDDVLTGGNITNAWSIDALNAGTVNTLNFSGFPDLVGGSAVDTFTLAGGSLDGGIDGQAGSDVLIGEATSVNAFVINGANGGTLGGLTNGFSNIENLTGGNLADSFHLSGGTLSGAVDGAAGSDTLTGDNVANTFVITGANSGTATGVSSGFSNIENLVGNAQVDSFTLSGGTLAGAIDGMGDADTFTLDNVSNTVEITALDSGTVTGISDGFSNIENLVGGSDVDSFVLNGGSLNGTIDGVAGNDSLTLDDIVNTIVVTSLNGGTATGVGSGYSNIENLVGGSDVDSFTLSGGTLTGSIDGMNGSDILNADNVANTFVITGANAGTVTGLGSGFSNIENLVGHAQADSFTLNGGTLSGTIDGAGDTDTFTLDAVLNTVTITTLDSGTATGVSGSFSNIENLVGGSAADSFILNGGTLSGSIDGAAGSDTLTGDNVANTFVITGANSGTVTGVGSGFSNIENLVGGSDVDSFTLNGGTVTGFIDGMSGNDTLNADNVANTFVIISTNVGTVTGVDNGFSNIENLVGNAQADSFTLSGGTLSGTLDGAGDADTFTLDDVLNTVTITTLDSGTATGVSGGFSNIENLVGGTNTDSFILNGGTLSGAIDGAAGSDTLTGDNVANSFILTAVNSGTATGISSGFSNIENLVGNAQEDSFTLSGGTLVGAIDGSAGSDTFTLDNVSNAIDITSTDSGVATGVGSGFSNIENLVGGNDTDSFSLNGGTLSGSIDGVTGVDTLTGDDVTNTFVVTSTDSGTATGVANGFSNIENLVGGSDTDSFSLNGGTLSGSIDGVTGADTLIGDDVANTFVVTGTDSGTATGVGSGFSNIDNLVGGSDVDTFNIAASGTLSGGVQGVAGEDTLDLSMKTNALNVVLSGVDANGFSGTEVNITTFSGIDRLIARSADGDTLTGLNAEASWTFDLARDFYVSGESELGFVGFEVANGGNAADTLLINFTSGDSSIPANGLTFNAGAGNDILEIAGGPIQSVSNDFVNGVLEVNANALNTINYTDLEVTVTPAVADQVFSFMGADDAITISDNGTASDNQSLLELGTGEQFFFNTPTNALIVNSGEGNDTISLTGLDALFDKSVTIDGEGGSDNVIIASGLPVLDDLNVVSEVNSLGSIQIAGTLNLSGVSALNGDFSAASITIEDLLLGGLVSTEHMLTSTSGDIQIINEINGSNNSLVMHAGSHDILLGGAASGLINLTGTANNIVMSSVTSTGQQTYNTTTALIDGDLEGAGISLNNLQFQGPGLTRSITSLGGDITISGSVNGGGNHLVLDSGNTHSVNLMGETANVSTLDVTGDAIAVANVFTAGAQTYNGPLTLSGNLTGSAITVGNGLNVAGGPREITGGSAGIEINGGIDGGGHGLFVNILASSGDITLNGDSSNLNFLTLAAVDDIFVTGDVTSTGIQQYSSAGVLTLSGNLEGSELRLKSVSLGSDSLLVSDAGDVLIEGIVLGNAHTLDIDAGEGLVDLGLSVSGLDTLTAAGSGIQLLSVATSGAQDYQGAVSLSGDAFLQGSTLGLSDGLNGNGNKLTFEFSSAIDPSSYQFTGVNEFIFNGAGGVLLNKNFITDGTQTYNTPVLVGADVILEGSSINLNDTLDSFGQARVVTLNSTGLTGINADIGSNTPLAELSTNAGGLTIFKGDIFLTNGGSATFNNQVFFIGDNAVSIGDGSLVFNEIVFDDGDGFGTLQVLSQTGELPKVTFNANADLSLQSFGGDASVVLSENVRVAGFIDLGAGDDVLTFMDGSSVNGHVDGGLGVDILDFSNYSTELDIHLGTQGNTSQTGGTSGFETVVGGAGNDNFFTAGGMDLLLSGNGGADTFNIATGGNLTAVNVTLEGGAESDTVVLDDVANTVDSMINIRSGVIDRFNDSQPAVFIGFSGIESLEVNGGSGLNVFRTQLLAGIGQALDGGSQLNNILEIEAAGEDFFLTESPIIVGDFGVITHNNFDFLALDGFSTEELREEVVDDFTTSFDQFQRFEPEEDLVFVTTDQVYVYALDGGVDTIDLSQLTDVFEFAGLSSASTLETPTPTGEAESGTDLESE